MKNSLTIDGIRFVRWLGEGWAYPPMALLARRTGKSGDSTWEVLRTHLGMPHEHLAYGRTMTEAVEAATTVCRLTHQGELDND